MMVVITSPLRGFYISNVFLIVSIDIKFISIELFPKYGSFAGFFFSLATSTRLNTSLSILEVQFWSNRMVDRRIEGYSCWVELREGKQCRGFVAKNDGGTEGTDCGLLLFMGRFILVRWV